jgi:DNA-binding transcriptional ArsR family regulator
VADDDAVERRYIQDVQTARAMAHPLRMRLVEELALRGPLTATELAEIVGESPANCSWHLRQLARYDFVEEAGGGSGRQRPWRMVVRTNTFDPKAVDAATAAAAQDMINMWMEREFAALRAWPAREAGEGEWAHAAYLNQSLGWLTLDELRDLGQQMAQLMQRYLSRIADPTSRPAGARPVRMVAWGIPADSES